MDSTDAVASLATKDIAARAAGARALSLVGTVEHLELLAGVAGELPGRPAAEGQGTAGAASSHRQQAPRVRARRA